MNLFTDIAIQQFLSASGYDLGPAGIDGQLGSHGKDTYSRRAIGKFQSVVSLPADRVWGWDTQRMAAEVLTEGIQLTRNFSSRELGCGIAVSDDPAAPHDALCLHWPDMINLTAVALLQKVRDALGSPIQVTSGVRCPVYNDWLSGSSAESRHMAGRAFDINAQGACSYEALLELGLEAGFSYGYVGQGYTHLQYDGPGW